MESIARYAVIGDCRSAALVSCEGAIDWLCLPHFSAPSVFGALLDPHGGHFGIRPAAPFSSTRRYIADTNVLETTFRTDRGTLRVTDSMSFPLPSVGSEPHQELLRIVECVQGEVEVDIRIEPRPDYGRTRADLHRRSPQGWTWRWAGDLLDLQADVPLLPEEDGSLHGLVRIAAGERRRLSLCHAQGRARDLPELGNAADRRCDSTIAWWRQWSRQSRYRGPHRDAVLRSALVLKLMTYAPSGAVVAAPTTSLPETPGGVRNWDYRYCWLRDAAMTMRAFTGLGHRAEARAFFDWLLRTTRAGGTPMRVFYDVHGCPDAPEVELAHWQGFGGAAPVRIGNAAENQLQLDVYGMVAYAVRNFVEHVGELSAGDAQLLTALCVEVCRLWRERDHGIWEFRTEPRHYIFSKAMCWIALDSILSLRSAAGIEMPVQMFHEQMAAIEAFVEGQGYDAQLQSYVAEPDSRSADASLLLLGCLGYRDPADPRMRGTYEHIRRTLGERGLLRRHEEGYDSLPGREGAFGVCSFWAVDHLACQGRADEACAMFEHILGFANDVGLFAEEIDAGSGLPLGNFPQAYTHVGLINAALSLARHQGTPAGTHHDEG
jgi:GH15 family glucan-1,4-alpha-glucosidase